MDVDVYIMLMLRALWAGEMGLGQVGERVARPAVLDGGKDDHWGEPRADPRVCPYR